MKAAWHQHCKVFTKVRKLEDYRLERWLALGRDAEAGRERHLPVKGSYHWTQRVQYAAGHAVNRYYAETPAFRRHANIGELVDYRWPRRSAYFDSEQSYWTLKDQVVRNLQSFFDHNGYERVRPVMQYEQFEAHIPALNLELSMIFQLAWQSADGEDLHLQKLVVDYDPQVLEGYLHTARVFCRHAFGADPAKLEVYTLLGGERILLNMKGSSYEDSLDYLRLAYSSMEEFKESTCSCDRCCKEEEESDAVLPVQRCSS